MGPVPGHGFQVSRRTQRHLVYPDLPETLQNGGRVTVINLTQDETYMTEHSMSDRQVKMVLTGGLINVIRSRESYAGASEGVQK